MSKSSFGVSLSSVLFNSSMDLIPAVAFESSEIMDSWASYVELKTSQAGVLRVLRKNPQALPADLSLAGCKAVKESFGDKFGSMLLAGTQDDQGLISSVLAGNVKALHLAVFWNKNVPFAALLNHAEEVFSLDVSVHYRHNGWLAWLSDPVNKVLVAEKLKNVQFSSLSAPWRKILKPHSELITLWWDANASLKVDEVVAEPVVDVDLEIVQGFISKGFTKKAAVFLSENKVPVSDVVALLELLHKSHPQRISAFVDACANLGAVSFNEVPALYVKAYKLGIPNKDSISSEMSKRLFASLEVDDTLDLLDFFKFDETVFSVILDRKDRLDIFKGFVDRFSVEYSEDFPKLLNLWIRNDILDVFMAPAGSRSRFASYGFGPDSEYFDSVIADLVFIFETFARFDVNIDVTLLDQVGSVLHDRMFVPFQKVEGLASFFVNEPALGRHVFNVLSFSQACASLSFFKDFGVRHHSLTNNTLPSASQLAAHVDVVKLLSWADVWVLDNPDKASSSNHRAKLKALIVDTSALLVLQGRFNQTRLLFEDDVLRWTYDDDDSKSKSLWGHRSDPSGAALIEELSVVDAVSLLVLFSEFSSLARNFNDNVAFVPVLVNHVSNNLDSVSPELARTLLSLFEFNFLNDVNRSAPFLRIVSHALSDQPVDVWATIEMLSDSWQGSFWELLVFAGCDVDRPASVADLFDVSVSS